MSSQKLALKIPIWDVLVCLLPVAGVFILSVLAVLFLNIWFYGEEDVELIAEIRRLSIIMIGGSVAVGSVFTIHSLFKLLRDPEGYYREESKLVSNDRYNAKMKRNSECANSDDSTKL